MSDLINDLEGWQTYIRHCAKHDLEMTGSDYDKTADYLGKAADALGQAQSEIAERVKALGQAHGEICGLQQLTRQYADEAQHGLKRIEQLEDALLKLSNEAAGWRVEDLEIIGGRTNAKVFEQRTQEARSLLAGGSALPCSHNDGIYVKNSTKHCVKCFQPQYDCLDCGERIIQEGSPIPGTNNLGYYRYCEACRDVDLVKGRESVPDTLPTPELKLHEPLFVHHMDKCSHDISIHKSCEKCRKRAVKNGAEKDNSDRYFTMPQTVEDTGS